MELSGYKNSNRSLRNVIRANRSQHIHFDQVPVLVAIRPIETHIDFVGQQHKPVLRIVGDAAAVAPQAPLPYDIRRINMIGNNDITLDYQFTTDQLMSLVDKGLYMDGFSVKESDLLNSELILEGFSDIDIVAPATPDEQPLVGVNFHFDEPVQMTKDNSGYDLEHELFDNYREYVIENGLLDNEYGTEINKATEVQDIFANDAEVEYAGERYAKSGPGQIASRDNIYDRLLDTDLKSKKSLERFAATLNDPEPEAVDFDDTFGQRAARKFSADIAEKREEFWAKRERDNVAHNDLVSAVDSLDDDAWDTEELSDEDFDLPDLDFDDEAVTGERESREVESVPESEADDIFADLDDDDRRERDNDRTSQRARQAQRTNDVVDSISAEERGVSTQEYKDLDGHISDNKGEKKKSIAQQYSDSLPDNLKEQDVNYSDEREL